MTFRNFVGREAALAWLEAAVLHEGGRLLRVSGAVGLGKTLLLRRFAQGLHDRGVPVRWLDAQTTEVGPAVIEAAASELARERDASGAATAVLVLDDLYLARRHERWLVSSFLPPLAALSVVVADRLGPSAVWFETREHTHELSLAPFTREEVQRYLEKRGIPRERHDEVANIAEGNPLLLSLACDVTQGRLGDLSGAGVLLALAHRLCEACDTPERRLGFATVLVSRGTPFEMLEDIVGSEHATPVFRWLRSLSVIEDTPLGLRPHVVVRKACGEWLRIHHPSVSLAAHRGVRSFCDRQAQSAADPLRWVQDRLFLDRELSAMRPYLAAPFDDTLVVDGVQPGDAAQIVALARAGEGEWAAAHVARALDDMAHRVDVVRTSRGAIIGFLLSVELGRDDHCWRDSPGERHPSLAVIRTYLERIGWLSSTAPASSRVLVYLHWSVAGTHQQPSPASNLLMAQMTRRLLLAPSLAFHFSITPKPESWLALIRFLGFEHEVAGTFTMEDTKHTVIANDWRRRSMADFLTGMSETAVVADFARSSPSPTSPQNEAAPDLGSLLRQRLEQIATQATLSAREQEVLDLLVLGRNAQEIGTVLGISVRTVKYHQKNLLDKIGADSRLDILRLLL